jgi:hypothetical protein
MNDSADKSLIDRAEQAASTTVVDHIVNALVAGLATVPFAGGFASLFSEYMPSAKKKAS